ncbi:hypothetical protein, partial [Microcoleus sp. herbarium14]|uniref:hypothetical protein n=1 Tax=Microcoleus sp. herbarium14 TaxID=3055439 RepID=UPI002FD57A7A
FDRTLVPPQRFGGRQGDLALIVKQQSVTGFDVKLTRRKAVQFPYDTRESNHFCVQDCRKPANIEKRQQLWLNIPEFYP